MLLVVAAALLVIVVTATVYTGRLLHIGILDAASLAEKITVPQPRSALDWPEFQLTSVLAEPDQAATVLLSAVWPAYPDRKSILLVRLAGGERDVQRLARWSHQRVPVISIRLSDDTVELRPRQRLDRVRASVLSERLPEESET